MYQVILGKPVVIKKPAPPQPPPTGASLVFQEITRKAWAHSVGQITLRLRQLWKQRNAPAAQQPHVVGWLRHLSEEAFKRIDEAQVRLSNPRHGPARRLVISREVLSIRPADPVMDVRDYKRVA